jgi:hypothetical protein
MFLIFSVLQIFILATNYERLLKCNVIAENENIKQRHKYKKESKQLLRSTYNGHQKVKESPKTTAYHCQHAATRVGQKVDH